MADFTPQLTNLITTGIQTASSDAGSATALRPADYVLADRYLAARAGRLNKLRGMYFSKLLAAGPMSDQGGSLVGFGGFNNPGLF